MTIEAIRAVAREIYDRVGKEGSRPPSGLDLPTGKKLARALGYAEDAIRSLPACALDAFVGVAALADRVTGDAGTCVLDLGCGAGLDSLVLAQRGYRVVAMDVSASMLHRVAQAVGETAGLHVRIVRALLPPIPVGTDVADWILMNGVANLIPETEALLDEVHRVLRPGGEFLAADILALGEIPADLRRLPEAWAWCLGGARSEQEWEASFARRGFRGITVELLEEFVPFARGVIRARKETR